MTILSDDIHERQRCLNRHDATLIRLTETLAVLSGRVAVLEYQVAEARKRMEENRHRFWTAFAWFVAVFFGSLVALVPCQLFLSFLGM